MHDISFALVALRRNCYEAAAKLVKRCQLRIEGQSLYPVADPAAEHRRRRAKVPRAEAHQMRNPFAFGCWSIPNSPKTTAKHFRLLGPLNASSGRKQCPVRGGKTALRRPPVPDTKPAAVRTLPTIRVGQTNRPSLLKKKRTI